MALDERGFGVLMPVFSLPGGTLDGAADFVQFLSDAGALIWQVLPLGPTHDDGSPYLALSVNAGNPRLIGMKRLSHHASIPVTSLSQAFTAIGERDLNSPAYKDFVAECGDWLDDFALYTALRESRGFQQWADWPAELRTRQPAALEHARQALAESIRFHCWCQFIFDQQWQAVLGLCHNLGIRLFGDIPLYVAHDSVDVWCHQDLFMVDETGSPTLVAGVPPDYFSPDGQLWGNPLYNWQAMAETGYAWWVARMHAQSRLFDIIRIDHFRGLESYWEIPGDARTALEGRWVRGPGEALLGLLTTAVDVDLVAEDLGTITAEVDSLRRQFNLPGIRVLQFGFDGVDDNPHNGLNVDPLSVLYTGTHDNDTVVGWYAGLPDWQHKLVDGALANFNRPFPQSFLACLFANHVNLVIAPLQDILGLDSSARVNTPGTESTVNWSWQLPPDWPAADATNLLVALRQEFAR